MKRALLLPFLLLLALSAAQAQKQVAIYYNQNWQVTKKENSTFTRLATVPDSLIETGRLFTMPFDRSVADYYNSGQILARGSYINRQKEAAWLFYYPNGQLQRQGSYKNNKPSGTWKFWYQSGQQLQEVIYEGDDMKLQCYWNENGAQTVRNGTGSYVAVLPGESGGQMQLKGTYVNGVRSGTWHFAPLMEGQATKPVIEQIYKDGALVKGFIYEKGRKVSEYTTGDRFNLTADFPYLATVEQWVLDENAFKPGFPVLAYMLKYDVQEVEEKNEAQQNVGYYQVIRPTSSGTDTLKLAKQLVQGSKPEFPGGEEAMFRFLGRTIRYPAAAQRAGTQGVVVLSFTVQPNGEIEDIKVVNSMGSALDNESIRVVRLMPPWKPALSNGVPVAAPFTLPVRFTLGPSQHSIPSFRGGF